MQLDETVGIASGAAGASRGVSRRLLLATLLVMRAAANGAYGFWVWHYRPLHETFFNGTAWYLVAEGALAFMVAATIGRMSIFGSRRLGVATAIDGLVRVIAAVATWTYPGWPDFPVTATIFFGIVGAWTISLAALAIAIRVRVRRIDHIARRAEPIALHEVLDPLFIVGIAALLVVAAALVAGPPVALADYHSLAHRWSALLAVAFTVATAGIAMPVRASAY